MNENLLNFILRVLGTMSEADCYSELFWRTDGENAPISFWINCSDFFFWGVADMEDLTLENIDVLDQSLASCREHNEEYWGPALFCARMRKMRPQGASYKYIPEVLWPLFNECGPEREVGMGNPLPPKKKEDDTPVEKKHIFGNHIREAVKVIKSMFGR